VHPLLFYGRIGHMSIMKLIAICMALLLVSCSGAAKNKTKIDEARKYLEDAEKARKSGPLEGDVRVIDGEEYVYGKNVKYMTSPGEPVNVWVRRDLYTPSLADTIPGRVGRPADTKELSELEERLAKLEQTIRGGGSPRTPPRPERPAKDATGRAWTLYFRNDDGLEWFLDEGPPLKPSRDQVQMWRRRVFPSWAFQKEIVTLDDLDCREARFRTRELRVTYQDGTTRTSDRVTPWANVFSGSAEDYLMQEYCK
jgi:hypothetical protein